MIPKTLKKLLAVKLTLAAAKDFLDLYPSCFLAAQQFLRRNHSSRNFLVASDTDIVIEGFPRCANSFMCEVFASDTGRTLKMATHVHYSSQVVIACRLGLPTLVLIRNPRDAVISLKALDLQASRGSRADRKYPIYFHTRAYVHFYERIVPYLNCVALADFSEVTQDVGRTIRRVNEKFGARFAELKHTADLEKSIFQRGGYHLSPNPEREAIKAEIARQFDDESNRAWAARAENLYSRLTKRRL
jgi:hypothetical protein